MAICLMTLGYVLMALLPDFVGERAVYYVGLYVFVGCVYVWAIQDLEQNPLPLAILLLTAIIFRLILLPTGPSLSDDVYRYIWEGHLWAEGISAYAYPVSASVLDAYSIPARDLVNHPWLASPYLPAAQIMFFVIEQIGSGSVLAFKVGAIGFDLLSGWVILRLLKKCGLPQRAGLIYFWNPLIVVEFAHGAHLVESLLVFLSLLAFDLGLSTPGSVQKPVRYSIQLTVSAFVLSLAALTKGIPGLFVFALFRRWGWRRLLFFVLCTAGVCVLFAWSPGWGLSNPATGTGLLGSLRVYLQQWHNNGGFMHWIELVLYGYNPVESIQTTELGRGLLRLISGVMLGTASLASAWMVGKQAGENQEIRPKEQEWLWLLRVSILPFWVYLLVAQTVYPWYLVIVLAFLPFFYSKKERGPSASKFIPAWIYFSITVNLTYLSHYRFPSVSEYILIQVVEYIPFYILLIWASWPYRQKIRLSFSRKG